MFKKLNLKEIAIAYLARYNNTEKGLKTILENRLRSWARQAQILGMEEEEIAVYLQESRNSIPAILQTMKQIGGINDLEYTLSKARSLLRSGNSRKVIHLKLRSKGVEETLIHSVLKELFDSDIDLAVALTYAHKRRIGPYRRQTAKISLDGYRKEQMILARGGFSRSIAEKVLSISVTEAEKIMFKLKAL